jgi:hypothetical protein
MSGFLRVAQVGQKHFVRGEYEMKHSELSFTTRNSRLVHDARIAHQCAGDFTVKVRTAKAIQTITGRVVAIVLVGAEKPERWIVVMTIGSRSWSKSRE